MTNNPNRLSRFWQELKRRRVIHVITVYASAAFVLIELTGNLTEPLNLPSSFSTIVIIVLAVGFLPAIILSWIYDLSSGTLKRTGPKEEFQEEEKAQVPNAWKVATIISFVIIVGLVVFNIVSRGNVLKPGMIQSLAVLPFDNFTGDEQLDYVVAGLHTSLIGDIGKVGALRVIGKTSSNIYKNSKKSAPEIAKELKVEALVEPSVLCYGDSVCLQIRLITMYPKERQLFVEEYKVDKSQILNLYNQITKQIAQEMMVEITPEQERLLANTRTVDREAYDAFLWGSYLLDDGSEESLHKALEYLNSAIEKDPDWAPLYSGLVSVWLTLVQGFYVTPENADPKIIAYRNKALELDPDLAEIHALDAGIAFLTEWNWEKAEREYLKAIAANPNDAPTRVLYGHLLCCLQRPGEALTQGKLAIELDPGNPQVQTWYSAILMGLGDCETALTYGEKMVAAKPDHSFGNYIIQLAGFRCKDYEKSFRATKYLLPLEDDAMNEIEAIFDKQGFVAAFEEITNRLEVLALKGMYEPMDMVVMYIFANRPDKAMDWIERGFEVHSHQIPYIATGIYNLDTLYENPRFIAVLEKMNLPLPPE